MRPESALWVGLAAVAWVASCDTGEPASPSLRTPSPEGGDTVQGSDPPGCGGAPTLSAIQDGVFSKGCAFSSCHGGPNPAAGLDLQAGRSCAALVGHASCLFSGRVLVVPGHPEQSYLFHKIAGDDLGTNPDGPCAGLANGTPSRMPLAGQPLCQAQIDQVRGWIAGGATCDGPPDGGDLPDGASDAPADATADATLDAGAQDASDGEAGPPPVDVAAITSAMSAFNAGQSVSGKVTLAQPAPPPGVSVALVATDPTTVAAPSAVFVAAGKTTASFEIAGMRPGHASLQASAGGKSASLDELVLGLGIAEVFYDASVAPDGLQWIRLYNATSSPIDLSAYSLGAGKTSYTETKVQLAGVIAPGACFVVGGPTSSADNGSPVFAQVDQFVPDIPIGGSDGAGVGVFGVPASALDKAALPIDAVVFGVANTGQLLARDGTVATPAAVDVLPGDSLMLLGGAWVDEFPPAPTTCGN
jgi:hypothetical protein